MTAARPIGALRRRLTLERAVTGPDDTVAWTAVATLWASISPVSATESSTGAALAGTAGLRIETRWRNDLTSRDRLTLGARIFRVVATHDLDERRRRLVVIAEEEGR